MKQNKIINLRIIQEIAELKGGKCLSIDYEEQTKKQ